MVRRVLILVVLLGLVGFLFLYRDVRRAPHLELTSIYGERMRDFGKLTLVNFWSTDCVTCIREFPAMLEVYNKFKDDGYSTVLVAMHYDTLEYVKNYVEENSLPFFVVYDEDGSIAERYGDAISSKVYLTPTSFLLDGEGNIVWNYVGELKEDQLNDLVKRRL